MASITNSPTEANLWHTLLEEVWEALAPLARFESVAEIHRGMTIPLDASRDKVVSAVPLEDFVPGLSTVEDGLTPYSIQGFKYLNVDPDLIIHQTHQLPWNQPKIIAHVTHGGRVRWSIVGAIDERGLVGSQQFYGIWLISDFPLEVGAALINGPIANAFVSNHNTSRSQQKRTISAIPIPEFSAAQVRLITSLVRQYRSYAAQARVLPGKKDFFAQLALKVLWRIDGLVLNAYNLPMHLERLVLDYFSGYERPGLANFFGYYPKDYASVTSWNGYLAENFPDVLQQPSTDTLITELRDIVS